ncbi:MAG: hypothetical protein M3209_01005 [Acidobacteriota bacterium]|nr:hypothetical protein [Acidobacteriota bacterium]
MKQGTLIYGFVGLVIGLVGGFWAANTVARNFSQPFVNQKSIPLKQEQQPAGNSEKLTGEEIKASFAAAESRKDDFVFQKKLGLALARYAAAENDASFLPELINLLERASRLANEKDFEILMTLADVYFFQAREKNDPDLYDKSKELYQRAIRLNPDSAEAKMAYASTFLYSKPPRPDAAVKELNLILKQFPRNEGVLQLLISALIQSGDVEIAEQRLSELKKINSNNPAIPDLESQLTQNKIKLKP